MHKLTKSKPESAASISLPVFHSPGRCRLQMGNLWTPAGVQTPKYVYEGGRDTRGELAWKQTLSRGGCQALPSEPSLLPGSCWRLRRRRGPAVARRSRPRRAGAAGPPPCLAPSSPGSAERPGGERGGEIRAGSTRGGAAPRRAGKRGGDAAGPAAGPPGMGPRETRGGGRRGPLRRRARAPPPPPAVRSASRDTIVPAGTPESAASAAGRAARGGGGGRRSPPPPGTAGHGSALRKPPVPGAGVARRGRGSGRARGEQPGAGGSASRGPGLSARAS